MPEGMLDATHTMCVIGLCEPIYIDKVLWLISAVSKCLDTLSLSELPVESEDESDKEPIVKQKKSDQYLDHHQSPHQCIL